MNDFVVICAIVVILAGKGLLKKFLRRVLPNVCAWADMPPMKKVNMTGGAFTTVNGNVYVTNVLNDSSLPVGATTAACI
ncbi:hypothetical protein GALMADRAFT_147178 [Galerina marginata CBS 339.88]|uniref:Uncharacterized protein n=1 Tax=Galerina marginata (strain CBS 339.88) TaxID=685588 RepID=A0A067SBS3_GALM3|nr:hypothetical protein GALMADRAFT_147178 [Galerina marginata CBS 339.88]